MFVDYKEKQKAFYDYIFASFSNNKISHAYLIETNNVDYADDLAISLAKFFLCNNNLRCDGCNVCDDIDISSYPDIRVIDSDSKAIKKEQVLDLQKAFSVKPIYGRYLIYIIKNANLLNKASANTLLKFLEEPNDNIIAILLTNNLYNVIDTIVSRCQVLSLKPEENSLLRFSEVDEVDSDVLVKDILSFFGDIEEKGSRVLISKDVYRFKDNLDLFFKIGLYLYFDVINCLLKRNMVNFDSDDVTIIKIMKNNEISDIIWKIDLINQFIEMNKFNVNKELFIDKFIIMMGGKK